MTTKKAIVFDYLKKKIITLSLKPGEPLNEGALSKELKTSKTPIREALQQLEKEGFVENVPGRGFFVSRISLNDIREIYEIREILECEAIKKAVQNPNIEKKVEPLIKKFVSPEEGEKVSPNDFKPGDQIHLSIFEAVGNERLLEIYKRLQEHIMRIRFYFLDRYEKDRMKASFEEHLEILNALKSKDPARAEDAVRNHLRNSLDYLKMII